MPSSEPSGDRYRRNRASRRAANAKRPMPPSRPPTEKQLRYIAHLSELTGNNVGIEPKSRAAATARIEYLKALRRRQQ